MKTRFSLLLNQERSYREVVNKQLKSERLVCVEGVVLLEPSPHHFHQNHKASTTNTNTRK